VLVRNGFAVLEAADGVEALTVNAPAGIDLLVTDVVMPRMRGTELAQRLSQRYPRLRTVFISGYSEQAVQDVPAGGARYLQKPFDAPQLLSAIRSALEEVAHGG
jgi:CheY-like chemotaxis protein